MAASQSDALVLFGVTEAAWAVVEPVLKTHHRVRPYNRGSWGPKEANDLIAPAGSWNNPHPEQS